MPSSLPRDRLNEIIENCDRIFRHINDMSLENYLIDEKTKDAVERCLSRISEAAYKIGNYMDSRYPDAEWKGIRGMGNPLRHQYDQIIDEEIWKNISKYLPAIRDSAIAELTSLDCHNADSLTCPKCHSVPCTCGDGGTSGGQKF